MIGLLFALLGIGVITCAGIVVVTSKTVTVWAIVLVVIGALILFWGGVIVPNSGVEDGAKKLTVFVGPFLPYLPGGRRASDPPLPPPGGQG